VIKNKPEIQKIVVGPVQTNCFIVKCPVSGKILVIDPGDDSEYILQQLDRVDFIVYTHGHFDHIGGAVDLITKYKPVTCIHSADKEMMRTAAQYASDWGFKIKQPPEATKLLRDGDSLAVGSLVFKVLHTPGHSPGSICLSGYGIAFSGDTLFAGSIGRTDLPASSFSDIQRSLEKIVNQFTGDCLIYPGHGSSTTMNKELENNPFLVSLAN